MYDPQRPEKLKRRNLLALTGSAIVATTAGCLSSDDEPANGETGPSDDNGNGNGDDDGDTIEFGTPELKLVEYDCQWNTDDFDADSSIVGGNLGFTVRQAVLVENLETPYPTVLNVEYDDSDDMIHVLTGFTDEVPDEYDYDAPDASSDDSVECFEHDNSLLEMYFRYGFPITDSSKELSEGERIRWEMEHLDGSVEEVGTFTLGE